MSIPSRKPRTKTRRSLKPAASSLTNSVIPKRSGESLIVPQTVSAIGMPRYARHALSQLIFVDVLLRLQLFHQGFKENLLIVGSARQRDLNFLEGIVVVALRRIDSRRAVVNHPIIRIFFRRFAEQCEGFILFALGLKLTSVIIELSRRSPSERLLLGRF